MSSRTSSFARLVGACAAELRQALQVDLTSAEPLRMVESQLAAGQLDLLAESVPLDLGTRTVLADLAPAEFGRAEALVRQTAALRTSDPAQAAAVAAQAAEHLRDAAATAAGQVDRMVRDIVSNAAVDAGRELGYTATVLAGEHHTAIDLRQGHHVLLALVGDDGTFVDDQAGLADSSCQDRHDELLAAMSRRGVNFHGETAQSHDRYEGGELIRAAAAADPVLARGAVAAAERQRTRHDRSRYADDAVRARPAQRLGGAR